jgi:glycolate oxidase FAD binding subunit
VITPNEALPLTETLTPADEAAVAATVRDAHRGETPVYPLGGQTALDFGVRPTQAGIGLSLSKLNRVVDYPADDMTITVEAGLTIAQLANTLAKQRQWLPVDVPFADRATVGGAVAANTSGPRRYACGTWRDYVLGLRAVDGGGVPFAAGGRVVKNAAGYGLSRLLVGSLGTLGVITQVTLMVRPLPETAVLLICELDDLDAAEPILAALVQTKTLPAAIELQAGQASQDCPGVGPVRPSSAARLLVGFEGGADEVEWMEETLRSEWRELGITSTATIPAAAGDPSWTWLVERPADVQVSVRPGATVEMIDRLLRADPDCSILAHAGNGLIRAALSPRSPVSFCSLLREQLRPMVAVAAGKLTVLSYPDGAELTAEDVWGPVDGAMTVMRALKERFDPGDVLNRGRYIF